MILELSISAGAGPARFVKAEINLDSAPTGWPDSIPGKVLNFPKEDWVDLLDRAQDGTSTVRQDVSATFKGKRYKFSHLDSEGVFELKKDWKSPLLRR
jgi:hypothetical protein